jgi:hypothetical protein
MSAKVRKAILKIRPDLGDLDGYLYFRPVGHVLRGFLCETRPEGIFIVPYAFPLYTGENRIHLGYADQLPYPEDFIEVRKGSEAATAADFVSRLERHEGRIQDLQNLDNFLRYIEAGRSLQNPWIRRGYTMTLIMLGREAEARTHLQVLMSLEATANYPGFDTAIAQISAELDRGLSEARAKLQLWEAEAKSFFGLL